MPPIGGLLRYCAAKAELQTDPKLRQDYLQMQQRWLSLARSYEFSEQLEFLSAAEERNKETRLMLFREEPRMKLRCFEVVFPIAFHAEVLGVLIAVLPMGVFAAFTMDSGRWSARSLH